MSQFAKTLESYMRQLQTEAPADGAAPANDTNTPIILDAQALRTEIGTLELLRGMGPELLDMIVARCPARSLLPGETLLAAGQTNSEIFVVLSGELHVYLGDNRAVPVAVLRTGDTVGELSAIDKKPTSASVVATQNSLLLRIDENMFWHIIHASHGFAVRLILKLAERLRANNSTVQANRELCAHFEQVALSDALTGVHSRRWLDETLPRLCERHRFDGQPMSVAIVDVDHFKRINDEHGHALGDEVLSVMAALLRDVTRDSDLAVRVGGEEFLLVFANTTVAEASQACERLLASVREYAWDGLAADLSCTVSAGVAQLNPDESVSDWLVRADAALYTAKHAGRDSVHTAPQSS
jgi:diguanylate cyclase (GGDEF)-like protein